jgi:hypothetical protein
MSAGVANLAEPHAVIEPSRSIGSDNLYSEWLARAVSFIEQVLNYSASNPGASVSRQQSYVNAANLFVAALDHHSSNRLALKKNNVVVGSRVLGLVGLLLAEKLNPEQHRLLRRVPLSGGQVLIARATVEII